MKPSAMFFSIRRSIDVVCTMGTEECWKELCLFLTTLRTHHPTLSLVIGSTTRLISPITAPVPLRPFLNDAAINWIPCLDRYRYPPYAEMSRAGARRDNALPIVSPAPAVVEDEILSRKVMENRPGLWYDTQHTDFMMEKANLLEWAFAKHHVPSNGRVSAPTASGFGARIDRPPIVAFIDADVCHLGPLPTIPAEQASKWRKVESDPSTEAKLVERHIQKESSSGCVLPEVALSPHRIRAADEHQFGKFNGGFVVFTSPEAIHEWRRATIQGTRFFDQASLENVWGWAMERSKCGAGSTRTLEPYLLPPEHNYGYWRLMQTAETTVAEEAKHFHLGLVEMDGNKAPMIGIHYRSQLLCSIHTHFFKRNKPFSSSVNSANDWDSMRLFNTLMIKWMKECVDANRERKRRMPASSVSSMLSERTVYNSILELIEEQ